MLLPLLSSGLNHPETLARVIEVCNVFLVH